MAIKTSNQITFTEQKKIVEIKEWYLATEKSSGVTKDPSEGWTTEVQTMDEVKRFLWNYEEVVYSIGSSDISDPVILGIYGSSGTPGASLELRYKCDTTTPTVDDQLTGWSTDVPMPEDGQNVYMIQKLSDSTTWSTPIQISGYQGEAGEDGASVEYVYYISKDEVELQPPSYNDSDELSEGWTDSPSGINQEYQYEYVSVRHKPAGTNTQWGDFSIPVIWSKWGEKGQDGDGVEYKYCLLNSSTKPEYPAPSDAEYTWTDEPTGVSESQQYEYVVQIKTAAETDPIVSSVSLWAKYGADGKGISSIDNYYATTEVADTPPGDDDWKSKAEDAPLSPTDKYLWNYEVISYTNGTSESTEPAIIGVYGDSAASSVDFQIYSVNGFEFNDNLTSIELKTVAFKDGEKIESGTSYRWMWWNSESGTNGEYEQIDGEISSTLVVNVNDAYAFTGIKCEMTYDDIVYEDYVSFTQQTTIYTAISKFFNGTNIISAEEDYLIVYIELYKDNELKEALYANNAYISDANIVQDDGTIITDISGEFSDNDTMYFVCKKTYDGIDGYDVVLGKYSSEQWSVYESNYTYKNDLFAYTTSPVVFVPKEKISRSLNINFEIYDDNTIIARTATMVLDFNDPTISSTEPADPKNGQLWLDTSTSPSILKMWDGAQWINSGYQNGNVVYTSKPDGGYSEGDLWILSNEDAELFDEFGPGAMLKATTTSATFDPTHWVDADVEGTEQQNNIRQYFLFNKDTGLRIGQADDNFYVNISSTEMGFYDVTSGTAQKVVSISNQSATIKNLTVEDGATFNCEVKFGDFILKTESNGSLSLALST